MERDRYYVRARRPEKHEGSFPLPLFSDHRWTSQDSVPALRIGLGTYLHPQDPLEFYTQLEQKRTRTERQNGKLVQEEDIILHYGFMANTIGIFHYH
jgi:hypothetical protein